MKQYFSLQYWKGQRLLLLVFLLLHVVLSSVYITWQSFTFDERDYYGYSIQWLQGNVERSNKMYDSKTPVVAVAAIPRIIKQIFTPGYKATDEGLGDMRAGRYVMVVFTLITAVYLFVWMQNLFGVKAWIFPLLFFLFDPLVLGFSMIITSDAASGTCLLAVCYHLYAYYTNRSFRQLLFFSVWLALGVLCKASLLYFIPYLFLLIIFLLLTGKLRFSFRKFVVNGLIVSVVVLAIMNLAYFGKGSLRSLDRSSFQSAAFRSLSKTAFIKDIPVPIPFSYVQGLDMLQYHAEIGAGHPESTHHGSFLSEQKRYKDGFWYYYFYVGFYKIPIAILLLMIIGFVIVLFSSRNIFFRDHVWYMLPFIFFLFVLSVINPFQTGFRHFLLIYPFCFLFIATAVTWLNKRYHFSNVMFGVLLLYMFTSTARFFPWLISYTNEFIPDKKTVFKKIKDSGIDYGQNSNQLEKFIKQNPEYKLPSPIPRAGKYIVPAFYLLEYKHRHNASWLSHFAPVDHYQYSMFLFHISDNDINLFNKKGRQ